MDDPLTMITRLINDENIWDFKQLMRTFGEYICCSARTVP